MTMTATQGDLPAKGGWQVGSQIEETRRLPNGQFVKGMTVHFTTGYGVASSVWLPASQYSAENVRSLIAAKVKALDAVSSLSSTGGS